MNLIDKITEPTFTNSSKGLLTLFCIGLFKLAVGVDLTSTEIAIPWLPSIDFPHIERIIYLYWALVAFSIYRYSLHHFPIMRMHYFLAMGRFFRVDYPVVIVWSISFGYLAFLCITEYGNLMAAKRVIEVTESGS